MQVVTPGFIKSKKVLLRMDLDVPIKEVKSEKGEVKRKVTDDFRLQAAIPTLKLCLENASEVMVIGHIGRPGGVEDSAFSVAPIYEWLLANGFSSELENGKLKLLENLRFERGEDEASLEYAYELLDLVDPERVDDVVFVNEAFAAHHPASSTTVLPKLLPHFAGLMFAREVRILRELRDPPATRLSSPKSGGSKRPLVAIIGGVKLEDKGPAIEALSKIANTVLVGGEIASNITLNSTIVAHNVMLASLTADGFDITEDTLDLWAVIIKGAGQIIWNGPVGKIAGEGKSDKGTVEIAKMILGSKADLIVGGGDTVGFLGKMGLLEDFESKGFVSTGGGAMLKFLTAGTLPTIEALE